MCIRDRGKKYYDALKSVNNLVKDARKVQQTILMVGDITDIYINNYQKMMHDDNFSVEELSAIGFGYTKLQMCIRDSPWNRCTPDNHCNYRQHAATGFRCV